MAKLLKKLFSLVITAAISINLFPVLVSHAASVPGWEIANPGDQQLTTDLDTETKHSGAASLKMTYKTEGGDNVYAILRQYITVEPNTTYRYSMWVKGEQIGNVTGCISWGTRYSFDSLGKTFDWKKFEFSWYSGNNTRAEFQFILNSSTKAIWVDEMSFVKAGTDKNLFLNPGFEEGVTVESESSTGGENEEHENGTIEITTKKEISSLKEMGDSFLKDRFFPIFLTENVTIDGNNSEWDRATMVTGGNADITASFSCMYDNENFYLYVETPDDVHSAVVSGTGNWQYDSVQFVIGNATEPYGSEVNMSFEKDGPMYFYSEQWKMTDYEKIKSYGRHYEDTTYYEVAIPWELMNTSPKVNNLRLGLLVNDNDNNGRKYYEFVSGIGQSKSNIDFFHMYCVEDDKLVGKLTTPTLVQTDIEAACALYAVNNSTDEKVFTANTPIGSSEVTLPAMSVYREGFPYTFTDNGTVIINGSITSDVSTIEIEEIVDVERSKERILEEADKLKNKYLPELNELIKDCRDKGMAVDYEISKRKIIELNVDLIYSDMEYGLDFRAEYILNCLLELYEEAKTNLNAYLSGEEEPLVTYTMAEPRIDVDGQTQWASMRNSKTGEVEKRPIYQFGYMGFAPSVEYIEEFDETGYNIIAAEVGIDSLITQPGGIHGWRTQVSSKEETTKEIVYENGKNGNSVLEIVANTASEPNKYIQFCQTYSVKPNTTYEWGYKVKGNDVDKNAVTLSLGGWYTERMLVPEGTYDWKEFNYEFTTNENQTSFEFFIIIDGKASQLLIDNIYVREKGSKVNLLKNGDFETARNIDIYKGMIFQEEKFDGFLETIREAEKKGISVCVQLATHYWPGFATSDYENANNVSGHFTGGINYNHERVREVMEYSLKSLLTVLKDEPNVHSLILANEPGYCTLSNMEFYDPYYREYLAYIYENDISKLNYNYSSDYKSFDELSMQETVKQGDTRDWLQFGIDMGELDKTPMFYDWSNFNRAVYNDYLTFLYNTCRKYAPDLKIHIKQLASTWRFEHDYFRQWLRNGATDTEGISKLTDYNGCDAQGILNNSEQSLQTKMRWYDYMTSLDDVPIFNSEDHVVPDNTDGYVKELSEWCGATVWQGAVHGCPANATWLWAYTCERNGLYGAARVRPDVQYKQAEANMDLNRLGFEVKALTDAKAEVAVVDAYSSHIMDRIFENVAFNAWQSSCYSGQRTDFVTENQIADGKLSQYKIVMLPKCDKVKKETIIKLREFIANGGRVIMFGEDNLKYDVYGHAYDESVYKDVVSASRVVPIEWKNTTVLAPANSEIRDMLWEEFDTLGMNKVRIVNTMTGETVYDVEWEYSNYNDSIIINVNNYNWSQIPEVAIEVKGQRVSEFTEMRSMEVKNGTIELKPYEPVLLKVNGNV